MTEIQKYNVIKIIEHLPTDFTNMLNFNSFLGSGSHATDWLWNKLNYIDFLDELKSVKVWYYNQEYILEYDIYPITEYQGILMYEGEWDMINLNDVYESKDECIKYVLSNLESSVEYHLSEINYAQREYDETTKKLEEFKQKYTNGK